MIEINNLTKAFGKKIAVDDISFTLKPGRVTGFLGPNGAGKTTTMRCLLGLETPTKGELLIDGKSYSHLKSPATKIGAMIDAKSFHKARSAREHIHYIAAASGIKKSRVDEVLNITGLTSVAKKSAGGYSLGMAQRIGIAVALLGDPEILVLDEPVNGLDPEGVKWVRELCKSYAAKGRTVLLSSHLMSEVSETVDDIIIIGKGKIIQQGTIDEIIDTTSRKLVQVGATDVQALANALNTAQIPFEQTPATAENNTPLLNIFDIDPQVIGQLALNNGIILTNLVLVKNTLEESFMKLTHDSVEYETQNVKEVQNV